jgi:hypothetical protein
VEHQREPEGDAQPRNPTRFKLDAPRTITYLHTYHYNGGKGQKPGTLQLVSSEGKVYGLWQTSGIMDRGNLNLTFWKAEPQVQLPAGTYTVVDSDPATWSHNQESGQRGFALVRGR